MPSDIKQEKKPVKRSNLMDQFDNLANTSNLIRTPAEYKYTKPPERVTVQVKSNPKPAPMRKEFKDSGTTPSRPNE